MTNTAALGATIPHSLMFGRAATAIVHWLQLALSHGGLQGKGSYIATPQLLRLVLTLFAMRIHEQNSCVASLRRQYARLCPVVAATRHSVSVQAAWSTLPRGADQSAACSALPQSRDYRLPACCAGSRAR